MLLRCNYGKMWLYGATLLVFSPCYIFVGICSVGTSNDTERYTLSNRNCRINEGISFSNCKKSNAAVLVGDVMHVWAALSIGPVLLLLYPDLSEFWSLVSPSVKDFSLKIIKPFSFLQFVAVIACTNAPIKRLGIVL